MRFDKLSANGEDRLGANEEGRERPFPFILSLSKDEPREEIVSFWVYVLRCADDSYYTGHTDNLDHRLASHADGAVGGYTANRGPYELVFAQEFETREEALLAERRVKGWSRAKKEALMRGDWREVSRRSHLQGPSR